MSKSTKIRKGCKDVWNAFMVEGATFCQPFDIPFCPTTLETIPNKLVPYTEAKSANGKGGIVHFYIDDYKFNGIDSPLYNRLQTVLDLFRKFDGIITPDFSTCQDFPEAIKIGNTYRMRAFGYYSSKHGIPVVNNVRWGDPDTYDYSFAGLPENSILAISTHGCIKQRDNRCRFKIGLLELYNRLKPHTLLVYGNTPDDIFDKIRQEGVKIVSYPTYWSQRNQKGGNDE